MIERAGTCTVLSALIVIVAAVVLHRVEAAHKSETQATTPAKKAVERPPTPPPPIEPQPATAAPPKPKRPEAKLIAVKPGETFADVARRVYGEGADLDAFWKVNRDQLPMRESEIKTGMILRTPEF